MRARQEMSTNGAVIMWPGHYALVEPLERLNLPPMTLLYEDGVLIGAVGSQQRTHSADEQRQSVVLAVGASSHETSEGWSTCRVPRAAVGEGGGGA